mgnify:FL=1
MSKIVSKRVSNYELFFDLSFVLAISQMTSAIHIEPLNWQQIVAFITINIVMISIWSNEAYYYNKYGDSRMIDIYSVIFLMLWVGNLALNINFDLDILANNQLTVIAFNCFLILAYLTIALQYYLKGLKLGFNRVMKFHISFLLIYSIALLPLATTLIPFSLSVFPVYYLPLILPLFFRKELFTDRFNFAHFLERKQLLTILTFGESVVTIIRTYPLTHFPLEGVVFFLGLGFLFVFYIVQTFINVNHHQNASPLLLHYAHLIIILSLMFLTLGLQFIANKAHHELGTYFFIFSILAFFIGTLATSWYNHDFYQIDKKLIGQYSLILFISCFFFYILRQNLFLLGLSLVISTFLMQQTGMRYRRLMREKYNIVHPDPKQNKRDFS